MNELLFICLTIVALSLVLVALRLGEHWLYGLVATFLLIANLFASKLTVVFGLVSSLSIPIYAAIFLATDAAAEHFGKGFAYRLVWVGFGAQLSLVAFGQLIVRGSAFGDPTVADALSIVFGFIPRIALGSFVAYIISQNVDVTLFAFLNTRFGGKHLWFRSCASTITSQGIDSAIFLLIAFYGKLPNLGEFFVSVWIVKVCVALFDTPFLYLSRSVVSGSASPHRNDGDLDSDRSL